jgi:hypothetical protein
MQNMDFKQKKSGFEVVLSKIFYLCLNMLGNGSSALTFNIFIMAKIKFGMMMTDARGKLGGQVFSKNRSGAYIRTKVTPTNPQSTFQSAVRQSFGAFSQAWSGLTDAQRTAWDGAVSQWSTTDIFGDLKNPTGKNLYLRLNQQATQAGFSSFTAVPAKTEMVEGIITSSEFGIAAGTITVPGVNTSGTGRLILSATPVLSQGTSFVKNKLRDIYNSSTGGYGPVTVANNYIARFGAPTIGDNTFVGVKYVLSSGQASPLQIIKMEVVA